MDLEFTTRKSEVMPLNSNNQDATDEASITVEPSTVTTAQVTEVTSNHCIPPPFYYHVNIPPYQPSISGINDRGAPPSYEEAIDPNAPPPSYDSLFGRIREARKKRKTFFGFLQNVFFILLGMIGLTWFLFITIVLPLLMMVVGGLYLYDCPQEELIPIYLLVGGGFGILKQLLQIAAKIQYSSDYNGQTFAQKMINIFLFFWFLVGSWCVFKEYEPNYDPLLGKYCNKNLYLFAFYTITFFYAIFVPILILTLIITCGSILLNLREDFRNGGLED